VITAPAGVEFRSLWDFVRRFHESFLTKVVHRDASRGLSNAIGDLASDDPRRRARATDALKDLVHGLFAYDTGFLEQFKATWGAVLLWDDFHKTFINTGGFSNLPVSAPLGRYQIASALVDSDYFREEGFSEPMTDLIFQAKDPRPLVIVWGDGGASSAPGAPLTPLSAVDPNAPYPLDVRGLQSDEALTSRLEALKSEMLKAYEGFPQATDHVQWFAGRVRMLAEETLQSSEEISGMLREYAGNVRQHYRVRDDQPIETADLQSALQTLIWNRMFDDYWTHLYFVPAQLPGPRTVSGLVLACRAELRHPEYTALLEIVNRVLSVFHFNLYDHQKNRFARQAAVAAIMARNMSHNLGSHVMPRTRSEQVDNRLAVLMAQEPSAATKHQIVGALRDRLDDYVQKKADFLSEITTDPLMSMRPAMLFREVLLPFLENPLVIDNLAANEGVRFRRSESGIPESRLKVELKVQRGETSTTIAARYSCPPRRCRELGCPPAQHQAVSQLDSPGFTLRCPFNHDVELSPQIVNSEADVQIDLPGPLGEFAFYGFLENLIRNAAKHNRDKVATEDLLISVTVLDTPEDPDYYHLAICDSATDPSQPVTVNSETMPLYCYIRGQLSTGFTDDDGTIQRQAWGLKEMLVCASLLGGTTDFAAPTMAPPLTVSNDGGRLTFKFKAVRSHHVAALLQNWNDSVAPISRKELRRQGVNVCLDWKEFDETLGGGARRAVGFAVFEPREDLTEREQAAFLEELRKRTPQLPLRVLVFDPYNRLRSRLPKGFVALKTRFDDEQRQWTDASSVLSWLWSRWLDRWLVDWHQAPRLSPGISIADDRRREATVHVFLDQNVGDEPTGRWEAHSRAFNYDSPQVAMAVWAKNGPGIIPRVLPVRHGGLEIVLDRHGWMSRSFAARKAAPHAYMVLDKDSPDFISLFSPPSLRSTDAWLWPWELAEAGMLRILVIDERVAETAYELLPQNVENGASHWGALPQLEGAHPQRWHCMWTANVFVCTHFGFEETPKPLHDALGTPNPKAGGRDPRLTVAYSAAGLDIQACPVGADTIRPEFDLVLVHQGVLDNRCRGRGADLLRKLHETIGPVVVESGRGVPLTLAKDERFLPFSLVQHYLLGRQIGKLGLTRIIMGLARSRRTADDD